MRRAFFWGLVALSSLVGMIVVSASMLLVSLPDLKPLKSGCLTATMNQVSVCKGSPSYAPITEISKFVKDAVLISEDAAFYSHGGIDTDEMQESLKKDLSEGRFARGASTITQQLAKNLYLSKEKSILRKLKEVYLALQIEKTLNKNQILELYLNVVEFGPNIYGIKPAAQYYFHKTPAELNAQEAAFLAFLLPNPPKYSQSFFKGQLTPFARKMLMRILGKLQSVNRISQEEYSAGRRKTLESNLF